MKDHLVTHTSRMGSTKKMFDALVELYESNNTNRHMALRDELRSIKMTSEDSVSSYFMKISRVKDQLGAIDDLVYNIELFNIVLKGFPPSWESFIQGICAREKLPEFDRLWSDCAQREIRMKPKSNDQEHIDPENLALTACAKKG